MSDTEPEGPKYRLEHAPSGQATCQQAACKRGGSKIARGELRIGTHTLFDRNEEQRWYMAWRHWGCATKHQINGLKELTADDPTKAPGYAHLSTESQEQVRLMFDNGRILNKSFKDIRSDLAGTAPVFGGEILDAEGYKIDMPSKPAKCRAPQCATKIVRGELRVGFLRSFDGEHSSWVYKHWNCISTHDINALKSCYEQDEENSLEGLNEIPSTAKEDVLKTFHNGKLSEVPAVEVAAKAKKTKKLTNETTEANRQVVEAAEAQKLRRSSRKRTAAYVDATSEDGAEYVYKKRKAGSVLLRSEADDHRIGQQNTGPVGLLCRREVIVHT